MAGNATPATTALRNTRVAHTVHTYHHDPRTASYGNEAVEALGASLGIEAHQVLKTLVLELDTGRLAVAVIPVPESLSAKAAARAFGARKAAMADPI